MVRKRVAAALPWATRQLRMRLSLLGGYGQRRSAQSRNRKRCAAGIPLWIAEGIELFEVDVRDAGFFPELTKSGLIEIFVIKDEATGNRVLADEWRNPPLHKKDVQLARTEL